MRPSCDLRVLGRATALAVALVSGTLAARPPTTTDRFWAAWEGVELETWLALAEFGETLAALQLESRGPPWRGEPDGVAWLEQQVGAELTGWALALAPRGQPVTTMLAFAQAQGQAWLDAGFRARVDALYLEYRKGQRETGDARQAVQRTERRLGTWLERATTAKERQVLQAIAANRGLLLAQLVKVDRELHPAAYPAPLELAPRPGELPPAVRALSEAKRRFLLDCLCGCGSNANRATVTVSWHPAADERAASCGPQEAGACLNRGHACWRTQPAAGGSCASECAKAAGLAEVPALGR